MHGSPRSRFDNLGIWNKYHYRELGITGEPYLDVDFNMVFYLTDTGRRFDGDRVSLRDKPRQEIYTQWPRYHSIDDVIDAARKDSLPTKIMMTLHPQRWTNNLFLWTRELVIQNFKNLIKMHLVNKAGIKKTKANN